LLPSLRYGLVVLPAAALMAIVLLAVPGPIVLRASLAGAAYVAALLLLPGTVRSIAVGNLLPTARTALQRRP
jgi:hypothetical protein